MPDWYEINDGEVYRHKLTGRIVRVKHFAADAGSFGRVEWEASDCEIEGRVSATQEAQHFIEDFDLIRPVRRPPPFRNAGVGQEFRP